MRKRTIKFHAGLLLFWLAAWMLTWPAVLATFQDQPDMPCAYNRQHFRMQLGFAMVWSSIWWPLSPFMTGFYEHGWQVFPKECVSVTLSAQLPS